MNPDEIREDAVKYEYDDYTTGWYCEGCGALCESDCNCHDYDEHIDD